MRVSDINPFVRQALFVKLSGLGNESYREIMTRDCRMFYILGGEGAIIIEGERHPLNAGKAVVLKAATQYIWQSHPESGLSMIVINFDYTHNMSHIIDGFSPIPSELFCNDDIIECVEFDDCPLLNKPIVLNSAENMESRMHIIATEYQIGDRYCDELLSSVLKSVIFSVLRQLNDRAVETNKKQSVLTRRIIQSIQKHYNEPFTNEKLSEMFHFNHIYINRVFKKHTGTTVQRFLTDYRLRMSTELLKSSESSVGEIASLVGFDDLAYFSKLFKKVYGVTPTEYRK